MSSFLQNLGLFAILFIIVVGYRKIQGYYELKRSGLREDEKVYLAAAAFARGTPPDEVGSILKNCPEFDERDVEKILSGAIPRRADKDGGYRAFIRSVNSAVGDDLYDERRPPAKPARPGTPSRDTGEAAVTGAAHSDENRRLLK